MPIKILVSGIPRGYQFPYPDGNWLTEAHKDKIHSISPDIELIEMPPSMIYELSGKVEGIEIAFVEGGNRIHYEGELDWEDYLKLFSPSLKWIQLSSTGFSDNITPEIIEGTVTLTNSPGIHTTPIAESVLAAMLHHAKRLKQRHFDQNTHTWRQLKCDELNGRTVLIIGLGNIGKEVARLCKAFHMRVIGTKRRIEPVKNVDELFPSAELLVHLPKADYLVIAAPLTTKTENMLGDKEFKAMKETTYLINIGRGKIVQEPTMMKALVEGWIAGAYLDCLAVEPLPSEHPLWDMENVFIIPHDSHSSPYIGDRLVELFCKNLKRYVNEEPLKNVCDPKKGY